MILNEEHIAHRQEWFAALRSGEYKQGRLNLCQIEGGVRHYCCLGVVEEKAGSEQAESLNSPSVVLFNGVFDVLTYQGKAWLGADDANPWVDFSYTATRDDDSLGAHVAQLNDQWQLTFPQIADMIEYFGLYSDGRTL